MATEKERQERLKIEKSAVNESLHTFDEAVQTLLLILLSNETHRKKTVSINAEIKKLRAINKNFSKRVINEAYRKGAGDAERFLADKISRLDSKQVKEMETFVDQMDDSLDEKSLLLKTRAMRELNRQRRQKIQLSEGYEKGGATQTVKSKPQFDKEIVFKDSAGRNIKLATSLKLAVGDTMWDTMNVSESTVAVNYGFYYARHISVIDDRTSDICLTRDGKVIDLRVDQAPPLHPNCRSRIKILKNYKP